MTDMQTAKPVFVYYDNDVDPDDLHPAGVSAGTTYESASPEVAMQFHPKARILRYADGMPYDSRKAKAELKSRDESAATPSKSAQAKAAASADDAKARRNAARRATRANKANKGTDTADGVNAVTGPQNASPGNPETVELAESVTAALDAVATNPE